MLPILAAWIGAIITLAFLAYRDLQHGAAALQATRAKLNLGSLATGHVVDDLRVAEVDFENARSRVTNPLLLPLRPMPIVGRHLRSVTALADAATVVTGAADRAVRDASGLVGSPPASGAERLQTLTKLQAVVRRARTDLRGVQLGPSRALVGPLMSRREQFALQLGEARSALARADAALTTANDLLTGPRRYLLLVASNAEMRAGSGAFLSIGVLDASGGGFKLGSTTAAGDLLLDKGVPMSDADLSARWGWLEPNREWRNLGASPRFPANAELAAQMWKAQTGESVDGVLALDVETVRVIIAATGPVDAGGRTISADAVPAFLMHDQYVEAGSALGGRQLERRELLGSLAVAAVGAIEQGKLSVSALADGLARAVRGRHLLAWSADAAKQEGWRAAGAAGDLSDDQVLLGIINRGANKLDRFLAADAKLTVTGRDARIDVTLHNTTPDGEPAYIAGPNPATETAAGEYKGILAMTVPGFATDIAIDGVSPVAVAGRDGLTNVIGGEVRVPRGAEKKVAVRFRLPRAHGHVTIGPSARIGPVSWSAFGVPFTDVESRTLTW